ncbi:peripheral-type benzodiazepine receptor-associated protein 1-like [Podarcis muralis]
MTKDSPSGGGGGPAVSARHSPRKAASQALGGAAPAALGSGGGISSGAPLGPPPPPLPPAAAGPPPAFHEDHRRELESLRAELEAERLRSQECRRRFALESRELREAAERERQLLADQLRSKWEQQRARELHQLREAGARQRETEIRQLLRWKEAELREAQELLQRERDAAMRQARDLQRQLAEELVSRSSRAGGGGGSSAGLNGECRAKLQEVLGKLRWEVDGDQAARIRHLKAELELERSLFLKYILERFEGEHSPLASSHKVRPPPTTLTSHRLGKSRPRSLESLVVASCAPDSGTASKSRSLHSNLSRCEPHPHHALLEGGGQAGTQKAAATAASLGKDKAPLEEGAKEEGSADAPPEGKTCGSGSAGEGAPPPAGLQSQQQDWLSGGGYDQLVKQNTDLLDALGALEQRCTHLKEENALLRKSSFPEMQDKVKRLKRKNTELAAIAKRLEERAKKLQESGLKVGGTPIALALSCPDTDLYKSSFARQRVKDLSEQANVLLAKDQQLEALQKECWELQAKLSSGTENACFLNICEFDRLLRESQREVLRLQRQIMLRNIRESFQLSKMASSAPSSPVIIPEASAVGACLKGLPLPKEMPETLDTLVKDVQPETPALGNSAKDDESSTLTLGSDAEHSLQTLKRELAEKAQECKNLQCEVEAKQKRCDYLELQINAALSEKAKVAEENSQLHEKNKQMEKIQSENTEIKVKLVQATDDYNSAVQLSNGLEIKVESLEQVIKNMKETAEGWQQLESEHEKTLLVLQKKEGEIQQLHQMQTEIKREHEEAVQLLEAQVKELENQYHSQTKHFNLLTEELEQVKTSGLLESELSHATCNSQAIICPGKWEQCTGHSHHCNKSISDEDSASVSSSGLPKKPKALESQSNSSASESIQNSSKSCLNPEEDTAGETEDLETDKVSISQQLENQGPSKLSVFLARYSYDPFHGPNKNPEAELPLTAGEYVYIYGEMDEDGFYEGELMDGRRGLIPSNLVEEVSGNDLISFAPSEPNDVSYHSYRETSFPCQSASSEDKSDSLDEDMCVNLLSNRLGGELCDDQEAVLCPQNLTLIKQFARSILIGWDPPHMLDSQGKVYSYNIYVNTDLCHSVKYGSQMKAVIENLDLELRSYRISVQSVTDKGNSDKMQCTFLVGNSFHIAPALLELWSITATSAKITWLPSNSNYTHAVYLNEMEYDVTKAGVYWYTFKNLSPSTQYTVKVETLPPKEVLMFPQGDLEQKSAAITFTTPPAGPPHAPLDVQVQPSSSAEFLIVSWLPVTIDAAGSSNGVKVTGYAIYINGQKVTEVASPTAGSISLAMSQLSMFQGSWKVSVRTVSPFGESEDSVPALIPSAHLEIPNSLMSKFFSPSQASEMTFKEFLEFEDGHISATTSMSSSVFSHMCLAGADTDFTIHFMSDYKEEAVSVPVNVSQNHMTSSALTTSHDTRNKDKGDSILHTSVRKHSSENVFPTSKYEGPASSALPVFSGDTGREISEDHPLTKTTVGKNQPENSKIKVYTMAQHTKTKDPSFQCHIDIMGATTVSSTEFELEKGNCRGAGMHNFCLQEKPGHLSEKNHRKNVKQLCKELSNLSVSDAEMKEEQISRTKSWKTPLGDHNHISDLSDIEEEENQLYRINISGQEDPKPQETPVSLAELAKDKIMSMSPRNDQTVPNSGPQSSFVSGERVNDDPTRLFVALFDYDPITMSPNSDAAEEELSFKEGQILKVIGHQDADGFYRGECEGKKGYIPCNLVSEMYIESKEVKEHLLKSSYSKDENL